MESRTLVMETNDNPIVKNVYLESILLIERLHRRFLDVIKAELEKQHFEDINNSLLKFEEETKLEKEKKKLRNKIKLDDINKTLYHVLSL